MFGRISVHSFEWATVNGKVSLTVSIEIQGPKSNEPCDRRLKYSRVYGVPSIGHQARPTDIERNDFQTVP